ncbi:hypothetical protein [Azospirillum argentinense]
MPIKDYLLGTRGPECREYTGAYLQTVKSIYRIACLVTGVTEERDTPNLIVVHSRMKSCEYVCFGDERYIIFDVSLIEELVRLHIAFTAGARGKENTIDMIRYLGLHIIAEEYIVRGLPSAGHALAKLGLEIFDCDDSYISSITKKEITDHLIVSTSFIISHELSHWLVVEKRPLPQATIDLQDALISMLALREDPNDIKKMWAQRYGGHKTKDNQDPDHINNIITDALNDEGRLDAVIKKMQDEDNDIVKSAKSENEDISCDVASFISTNYISKNFGISMQSVCASLFLMFRNFRVISYLKEAGEHLSEMRAGRVESSTVRNLQSRHFTLRNLWRTGYFDGYDDAEISDASDMHDDIIDYPILLTYPTAARRMLDDISVIVPSISRSRKLSEEDFMNEISSLLSPEWLWRMD